MRLVDVIGMFFVTFIIITQPNANPPTTTNLGQSHITQCTPAARVPVTICFGRTPNTFVEEKTTKKTIQS